MKLKNFLGRVNATVLLKECSNDEEIKYFDFTSLYPAVMKKEKYPLGEYLFFLI